MKLDTIANYLLLQGSVTDGSNPTIPKLYLYEADASNHAGHSVFAQLIPSLVGMSVNDSIPNYHKGQLQLITTAIDVDVGYDLAEELSGQLTLRGVDLGDMYIYRCLPKHKPIFYRRNEQGMLEHSVNFDITIRLKS